MMLKNGSLENKKQTRIFAIVLVLALALLSSGVIVYADIGSVDQDKSKANFADEKTKVSENNIADKIFEKTGMRLEAKVGTLSYDSPAVFADEKVAEEIYNQTGMKLEAKVGTLFYEVQPHALNDNVNVSVKPSAIVPPTEEAPSYPFSANWSNTVNYTYTKYYFRAGDFDADADGPFDAKFYYQDGTYGGTITASYVGGKYQIRAFTDGMGYYYVVLVNNSSNPASNATYKAY